MNNYPKWKRSLLITISIFFCTGSGNSQSPQSVKFPTSMGPVTFSHGKHQALLKNDCGRCHHRSEEKKQACRGCHKKKAETREGDAVPFYDVKMNFCRGCHVKEREADQKSKAPVSCSDCHDIRESR